MTKGNKKCMFLNVKLKTLTKLGSLFQLSCSLRLDVRTTSFKSSLIQKRRGYVKYSTSKVVEYI